MHIGYTIIETALGYVLVAATERGVAAVRFGETEAALEAELAHLLKDALSTLRNAVSVLA